MGKREYFLIDGVILTIDIVYVFLVKKIHLTSEDRGIILKLGVGRLKK
jgi:hypothetical protein